MKVKLKVKPNAENEKAAMEKLMRLWQGFGVESSDEDGHKHYYFIKLGNDGGWKGVADRIKNQFRAGEYKVYADGLEEVDRLVNIDDEVIVIYQANDGTVISILDGYAIRIWKTKDPNVAVEKTYRAGFIF